MIGMAWKKCPTHDITYPSHSQCPTCEQGFEKPTRRDLDTKIKETRIKKPKKLGLFTKVLLALKIAETKKHE